MSFSNSTQIYECELCHQRVSMFPMPGRVCPICGVGKLNMVSADGRLTKKLEEAYKHIKPYLKEQQILREMCQNCEFYCGEEHDYEECRHKACFRCYLGYEYLQWSASYEG